MNLKKRSNMKTLKIQLAILMLSLGLTLSASANSNVIRIAHSEYAFTYDPLFCSWSDVGRICAVAYDALLKFEPTNKVLVPHLAKSYKQLDGGTRYRFLLNKNVTFHDGNKLTAHDVKYSYERVLALKDGVSSLIQDVNKINVIDDYTLDILLKKPTATFLYGVPLIMIINSKTAKNNEVDGDWGQKYLNDHDLGSGPYKLSLHLAEQRAEFKRHVNYWKGWRTDNIDGIAFLWIKDSATQRLMLEKGDLDIMMEPVLSELKDLKKNRNLRIHSSSSAVVFSIDFRTIRKPLDNINVRKALAHAVDYDYHLNVALEGFGQRAKGPLSSQLMFFNDDLPLVDFNMKKAKQYMKKAGYANGGFTLKVVYESAQAEKQRALEMIQQNWGMLGIKIEPVATDYMGQLNYQKNKDSDIDVYLGYLWPSAAETDIALRTYYHSDYVEFGDNAAWWTSDKVDKLFDAGIVEQNINKRSQLYKNLQHEIVKAVPSAFVSEAPFVIVANKRVVGYEYNPAYHQAVDVYNMTLSN